MILKLTKRPFAPAVRKHTRRCDVSNCNVSNNPGIPSYVSQALIAVFSPLLSTAHLLQDKDSAKEQITDSDEKLKTEQGSMSLCCFSRLTVLICVADSSKLVEPAPDIPITRYSASPRATEVLSAYYTTVPQVPLDLFPPAPSSTRSSISISNDSGPVSGGEVPRVSVAASFAENPKGSPRTPSKPITSVSILLDTGPLASS
jgi:hypothetical protein